MEQVVEGRTEGRPAGRVSIGNATRVWTQSECIITTFFFICEWESDNQKNKGHDMRMRNPSTFTFSL